MFLGVVYLLTRNRDSASSILPSLRDADADAEPGYARRVKNKKKLRMFSRNEARKYNFAVTCGVLFLHVVVHSYGILVCVQYRVPVS